MTFLRQKVLYFNISQQYWLNFWSYCYTCQHSPLQFMQACNYISMSHFVCQFPSHCRAWRAVSKVLVAWTKLSLTHSCSLLLSPALSLAHSGTLFLTLAHSCFLSLSHSGSFWLTLSLSPILAHSDSVWLTLAHSGSFRCSSAHKVLVWLPTSLPQFILPRWRHQYCTCQKRITRCCKSGSKFCLP